LTQLAVLTVQRTGKYPSVLQPDDGLIKSPNM